jgi:phage protein U
MLQTIATAPLQRLGLGNLSMMAVLGIFPFRLSTAAYQQLQKNTEWRHPANSRVNARPARQFVGKGEETITLSGTLYPELTGGRVSLDMLRFMGDTGKAWPLLEGTGRFHGNFVIETLEETDSIFFGDGAPRKIEFSLKLARVDDQLGDKLGELSDQLMSYLK